MCFIKVKKAPTAFILTLIYNKDTLETKLKHGLFYILAKE